MSQSLPCYAFISSLLCLTFLAGCALPLPRSVEYLDEETAATITTVTAPLVFARARPELASHARDYATLAPVTVNRSGRFEHLLLLYVWSTVDPRVRANPSSSPDALLLLADDRRIELRRDPRTPREAGIGRPIHSPAGTRVAPLVYRTDLATLRFIGASRQLQLSMTGAQDPRDFTLWRDTRAALTAYAADLAGDYTSSATRSR